MDIKKFKDEVYKLVYGNDVDVVELKKTRTVKEMWDDFILFVAKDDATKINEVRKMNYIQFLDYLSLKLKQIPKVKTELNPIGFKITSMEEKKTYEKISIALSPEILKKLDEGNYNKSKLIDSLLTEYFKKEKSQGEVSKEK
jgi:hypothetical protein